MHKWSTCVDSAQLEDARQGQKCTKKIDKSIEACRSLTMLVCVAAQLFQLMSLLLRACLCFHSGFRFAICMNWVEGLACCTSLHWNHWNHSSGKDITRIIWNIWNTAWTNYLWIRGCDQCDQCLLQGSARTLRHLPAASLHLGSDLTTCGHFTTSYYIVLCRQGPPWASMGIHGHPWASSGHSRRP